MEIALMPTEVGTLAAEGKISWDLPSSMDYTPGTQITAKCDVVNTSTTTRIYALIFFVLREDRAIIGEWLLDFNGYQAIELPSNYVWEFSLTFALPEKNRYVGLALWTCKVVGGKLELDKEVDRVECFLGRKPFDWTAMIGMVMPLMMLGIVMPLVKDIGVEEK